MDAKYFRERAALCLRVADGLSLNNPGRFQLMDLAEDFRKRAKELEAQAAQQRQQSQAHEPEQGQHSSRQFRQKSLNRSGDNSV